MIRFLDGEVQDKPLSEIEQMFGREFSVAVAALATGTGKVRCAQLTDGILSGDNTEGSKPPDLGRVRDKVQKDFAEEQRRKTNEEVFERLKARYVIIVQDREPPSPVRLQPVPSTDGAR